jgi:hypothetical protein
VVCCVLLKSVLIPTHYYMPHFAEWLLDIGTSKEIHMSMYPQDLLRKVITIRKCQFLSSSHEKSDVSGEFCLCRMVTVDMHLTPNCVLMFTLPQTPTPV